MGNPLTHLRRSGQKTKGGSIDCTTKAGMARGMPAPTWDKDL